MADRISNSVPVPNPRGIQKVLYNSNNIPAALGGVLSTNSSGICKFIPWDNFVSHGVNPLMLYNFSSNVYGRLKQY